MTNDELQALCNAATPGPWEAKNIPFKIDGESHDSWDVYFDRWQDGRWFDIADSYDEPTAKFVAAARTELPRLLAENARLRTEAAANGDTANQWRQAYNDQVIRVAAMELEIAQLQQQVARLQAENKRIANDAYRSTRVVGADEAFYQVDP